jgi:hypothetical protein
MRARAEHGAHAHIRLSGEERLEAADPLQGVGLLQPVRRRELEADARRLNRPSLNPITESSTERLLIFLNFEGYDYYESNESS